MYTNVFLLLCFLWKEAALFHQFGKNYYNKYTLKYKLSRQGAIYCKIIWSGVSLTDKTQRRMRVQRYSCTQS
jgi:hypothetical protein